MIVENNKTRLFSFDEYVLNESKKVSGLRLNESEEGKKVKLSPENKQALQKAIDFIGKRAQTYQSDLEKEKNRLLGLGANKDKLNFIVGYLKKETNMFDDLRNQMVSKMPSVWDTTVVDKSSQLEKTATLVDWQKTVKDILSKSGKINDKKQHAFPSTQIAGSGEEPMNVIAKLPFSVLKNVGDDLADWFKGDTSNSIFPNIISCSSYIKGLLIELEANCIHKAYKYSAKNETGNLVEEMSKFKPMDNEEFGDYVEGYYRRGVSSLGSYHTVNLNADLSKVYSALDKACNYGLDLVKKATKEDIQKFNKMEIKKEDLV